MIPHYIKNQKDILIKLYEKTPKDAKTETKVRLKIIYNDFKEAIIKMLL